jgi:hypothetical protein
MTILVDTVSITISPTAGLADQIGIVIDGDRDGIPDAQEPCGIEHVVDAQCQHTPEQFAEAALMLEPRGAFWSKGFGTAKAALYRAFGGLLSAFEARLCSVHKELLACESVELLAEWEKEYGTACVDTSKLSIPARQALVCQARSGSNILTLPQLETLLQTALDCSILRVEYAYAEHSYVGQGVNVPLTPVGGGICIRNIGPVPEQPSIQNSVNTDVGTSLRIPDPAFSPPTQCPIVFSTTPGDWDPVRYPLLLCLLEKHLPAHIEWALCPT